MKILREAGEGIDIHISEDMFRGCCERKNARLFRDTTEIMPPYNDDIVFRVIEPIFGLLNFMLGEDPDDTYKPYRYAELHHRVYSHEKRFGAILFAHGLRGGDEWHYIDGNEKASLQSWIDKNERE